MESYDQHTVEEVKASSEEYNKVQKNFMRDVDKSATIKKVRAMTKYQMSSSKYNIEPTYQVFTIQIIKVIYP